MLIREHLPETNTFEPDAIRAMSTALEEACIALHIFAGDLKGREIIATRIIDLARTGVSDAAAMRDRVMLESRSAA